MWELCHPVSPTTGQPQNAESSHPSFHKLQVYFSSKLNITVLFDLLYFLPKTLK